MYMYLIVIWAGNAAYLLSLVEFAYNYEAGFNYTFSYWNKLSLHPARNVLWGQLVEYVIIPHAW